MRAHASELPQQAVVLSAAFADRHRVRVALPGLRLIYSAHIRDAHDALIQSGAPMLITRLRDAMHDSAEELVREIVVAAPRLRVAVLVSCHDRESRDALALTKLGLADTLLDTSETFQGRLMEIWQKASFDVRRAEAAVRAADACHPAVRRYVRSAIEHGEQKRGVADFAVKLGCSISTLDALCMRHLGSPPRVLLMRGRMIAAMIRLESSLATVESVARALEFPSGPSFHNALRRCTGMKRTGVMALGGSEWLLANGSACVG